MSKQSRPAWIVVGLGFGDEGKGLATDFLCKQYPQGLVIRFNGGHQAGHTVVAADGRRHVCSSFGAGTLRGLPTYWSRCCTFAPGPMLKEHAALQALGAQPRLLLDGLCPVTTHYDVLWNRVLEDTRGGGRHGSCGLGFGATVARHTTSPVRLYAQDLRFIAVWQHKLQQIREYYRQRFREETTFDFEQLNHDAEDARFAEYLQALQQLQQEGGLEIVREADIFSDAAPWQAYLLEGAQGVLLDQEFGLFPHVTRSFTTSRNALELLARHQPATAAAAQLLYVTRAYHTRHGAGPLPHEEELVSLVNHENETNQHNTHQGSFRIAPLSIDLLNYALQCDGHYSSGLDKHLLITCLDQLPSGKLTAYKEEQAYQLAPEDLPALLDVGLASYHFSYHACADELSPLQRAEESGV